MIDGHFNCITSCVKVLGWLEPEEEKKKKKKNKKKKRRKKMNNSGF